MIWSHPFAFLGLLALPFVFYFTARSANRRYALVTSAFSKEMLTRLVVPRSKSLTWSKHALLFVSALAFVLVLCGPKSNEVEETSTSSLGRDVFVLFDVSESMNAEDLAPNRLSVAKLDVEDLLDAAVGDRVGLIAFAGSAQVEIPLTTDYGFFRNLLRKIDTTTVRMGGTAIGDAVRLALQRFGLDDSRSRAIVLITDGEDHESLPLEAAQNAADANVPIFTIAIGNLEGAKIPIKDASGNVSYKTYDGAPVISKPDVATLKEIANISGGRYYYANANLDLGEVYKTGIDRLARSELAKQSRIQLKDLYQPFLAIGLIAFALYYYMPTRTSVRNKRPLSFFSSSVLIVVCLLNSDRNFVLANVDDSPEQLPSASASTTSKGSEQSQTKTSERPAKKRSSREEVQAYNKAVELASNGQISESLELQKELINAENHEVSGRSNYNLGVDLFNKAKQLSSQMDAPNPNDSSTTRLPNQANENQSPSQDDVIANYNKGRDERNARRQELSQNARESVKRFYRGSQSSKLGANSKQIASGAVQWLAQEDAKENARELELRAAELPSPDLRLKWLQKEINDRIRRVRDSNKRPTSELYRSLFKESKSLCELEQDAKAVAQGFAEQINSTPMSPNVAVTPNVQQGNAGVSVPEIGQAESDKIDSLCRKFIDVQGQASGQLAQYDANAGVQSLQEARALLALVADTATPYDALVTLLANQETKERANNASTKLSSLATEALEDYHWNRRELQNAVDETLRKAKQIMAQPGNTLKSNADDSVDLDDVFQDEEKPSQGDSSNNVPNEKQSSQKSQVIPQSSASQKSREERIRESATIALNYQDELEELFKRLQSELTEKEAGTVKRLSSESAQKLSDIQSRTSQILQDIVRPLQDEQQNQQQNQSNDQQQDSQDQDSQSQNSQDSKSSDENKSQDQKDQTKETPDELKDPSEERQEENQENEKKAPQEDREQQDESSKDDSTKEEADQKERPQNNETKPMTPEEKEAEALMRQVERRQKDAEEERRLIRQALKKREKSGKDW